MHLPHHKIFVMYLIRLIPAGLFFLQLFSFLRIRCDAMRCANSLISIRFFLPLSRQYETEQLLCGKVQRLLQMRDRRRTYVIEKLTEQNVLYAHFLPTLIGCQKQAKTTCKKEHCRTKIRCVRARVLDLCQFQRCCVFSPHSYNKAFTLLRYERMRSTDTHSFPPFSIVFHTVSFNCYRKA